MKKDYTKINIKELFDYLDWYSFVDSNEIYCAICDFIENKEKFLYWSDCAFAFELCNEYCEYLENQN